jgi:uronate dehydrogenase
VLRPRLKVLCDVLRVSDLAPVRALLKDVNAVVQLGGISTEHAFEETLPANIVGTYNVCEAAREHVVRRIVFASSNPVTGFYTQPGTIDAHAGPPRRLRRLSRPSEKLAQFCFERHGIETVSLRIGSSFAEPADRRMLAGWLSFGDLRRRVLPRRRQGASR